MNKLLAIHEKMNYSKEDKALLSCLSFDNNSDLYILACTLCQYEIEELDFVKECRLKLFIPNFVLPVYCINEKQRNKYHHFMYTLSDSSLASQIWNYANVAIKYVERKDGLCYVSISRDQFDEFINMLNDLGVKYDIEHLREFIFFDNNSNNELVDITSMQLPFEPYEYQVEDAQEIVKKKRVLLGHDMGCGKTFISYLVGASISTKKLIICPESLRLNWKRELELYGACDVHILLSNETYHSGEWTIVGYLSVDKFDLSEFDCLFIDEAHYCKSVNSWGAPNSKRAKNVIKLAEKVNYCYPLTGTPLPSKNVDLFNILRLLNCIETESFFKFGEKFCDAQETIYGKTYSGNSNSNELHDILNKRMVRRLKKHVLPHLKKQRQFIPIEPKLTRDYIEIEKRLYDPIDGDSLMSLSMTGRKLLSEIKIKTAIELIDSFLLSNEPVVVVTNFINTAKTLKEYYGSNAVEITGNTSQQQRHQNIIDFQAGKKQVCILNMLAGGVGITLTKSSKMIMLDYDWIPSNNIQVEDRICRPGQNETCTIYYVYCVNAVFDNIFVSMLSRKSANIDRVIDNEENQYNLAQIKQESSTFLEELKKQLGEKYKSIKRKNHEAKN